MPRALTTVGALASNATPPSSKLVLLKVSVAVDPEGVGRKSPRRSTQTRSPRRNPSAPMSNTICGRFGSIL